MAHDYYLGAWGPVELSPATDAFSLAAAPGTSLDDLRRALYQVLGGLGEWEEVTASPRRGVMTVRLRVAAPDADALAERIAPLARLRSVEWVMGAARIAGERHPIGLTELIVVRADGTAPRIAVERLAAEIDAAIVAVPGARPGVVGVTVARPSRARVLEIAHRLRQLPGVAYAEPSFMRKNTLRRFPNDSLLPSQWQAHNWGQNGTADADMDLPEAWGVTGGSRAVVVGILDDGVDLSHPDLAARLVSTGWDFEEGSAGADPKYAEDAHGTSVAGMAAATGGNGIGVAGACPLCGILPMRFGPEDADTIAAFGYARDQNIPVLSNSWGYANPTAAVADAIADTVANGRGGLGTLVLFAAGNDDEDIDQIGDISALPVVVAVSATTHEDTLASYSNFGDSVSLSAPGGDDEPAGANMWSCDRSGAAGYTDADYTGTFNGTSAATPLVAGVAGLVFTVRPEATAAQVRQWLESTADVIDVAGGAWAVNGRSPKYGWGRVNARRAVAAAAGLGELEDCGAAGDEDGNGVSGCDDPACAALPECAPVADPCAGITYEGCCTGKQVVWCAGDAVLGYSCGDDGCGWVSSSSAYDCGGVGEAPGADPPLSCGTLAGPLAPGCSTDEDCFGGLCDGTSGACVACLSAADCDGGVCDAGTCVECLATEDCASGVCDSATKTCVGCLADDDCEGGVCDAGTCVECLATEDCASGVCDAGTCVECLATEDCASGVCDGGTCVECLVSGDCTDGVCDGATKTCVGCLANGDCADGVCDSATKTCVGCLGDTDCADGV
ncbi:MAG: hypothetical protein CVU56_25490, partial [Deltaproteobacteria bacterium HGW-Deltaproteobacteria-14]